MSEKLTIRINRDTVLLMIGWLQAKRPEGEWDPAFLTSFLETLEDAAQP